MGYKYVAPKINHGSKENVFATKDLVAGWAESWKSIGVDVVGWGWLDDDPAECAALAVNLCKEFKLAGYIIDGEDPIEGPVGSENWKKSAAFCKKFRELAPRAPLALSYIGDGYPYRMLDFDAWKAAGATFMPQCYWGAEATSIQPSVDAADRAGIPRSWIVPTLGTSALTPYPNYPAELQRFSFAPGFNVWLLDSTKDDVLRGLPA